MDSIPIYNTKGEETGKVELNPAIFNGRIKEHLLHQALVMYLANKRQGTASTRTRSETRGGKRKPWRQKGTGRARAGSIRSPLWRGGGVAFGPHPRDYGYHLSRAAKREALVSALNAKVRDSGFVVVDELSVAEPGTKDFIQLLVNLGLRGGKKRKEDEEAVLILLKNLDPALVLSSRNVPKVTLKTVGTFSTHDLLLHPKVLVTAEAWKVLEEKLVSFRKDGKSIR